MYGEDLLNTSIESKKRRGKQRTYGDLIKGRFDLKIIVTVERKDDIYGIYDKWSDYTSETIDKIIKEGEGFEKRAVVKTTPPNVDIV